MLEEAKEVEREVRSECAILQHKQRLQDRNQQLKQRLQRRIQQKTQLRQERLQDKMHLYEEGLQQLQEGLQDLPEPKELPQREEAGASVAEPSAPGTTTAAGIATLTRAAGHGGVCRRNSLRNYQKPQGTIAGRVASAGIDDAIATGARSSGQSLAQDGQDDVIGTSGGPVPGPIDLTSADSDSPASADSDLTDWRQRIGWLLSLPGATVESVTEFELSCQQELLSSKRDKKLFARNLEHNRKELAETIRALMPDAS